jgi:iron complex outermembrane receptor protein
MKTRIALLLPFHCGVALLAAATTESTDTSAGSKSGPVHLEDFVISASPLARARDEVVQPTTVLAGRRLEFKVQPSLGETLSDEPGIASTYFGPGASRPIIRGLGGDRIRVLTGGVGTIDASVVSPDHAISLEPILLDRIEVVRGPASLLYGGAAVGGVVNAIDGRIPENLPSAPLSGRFELRANSVADERTGAGLLTGAAGRLAWRLDGFRRQTGDVRIPGTAPVPTVAAEMLAAGETPGVGHIPNSAVSSSGGSFGASYIGNASHLGLAYSGFDTAYGTVAEPTAKIDLRQRRWDIHGESLQPSGLLRAIKLNVGLADYQHDEIDEGELGTRFTNRGYEGRLEFLHERLGAFEGALGLQGSRSDFAARGTEAFLPSSITENHAVFVYEEAAVKPFTFQLGARVERQSIDPDPDAGLAARALTGVSLSAGAVWALREDYALALSLTRNERLPNSQELYADGPHVGTNAFEIGDARLASEVSHGFDLSFRKRQGTITGALTLFLNQFDGYIFERATGAFDPADGLRVYQFVQRDARFHGGELEVTIHLHKTKTHAADLRFTGDYVRADNRTDREPLPRITPLRFGVALDWHDDRFTFTAEARHTDRQRRLSPGETSTPGFEMLQLGGSWRIPLRKVDGVIFARITNLGDVSARLHTSFLKDLAPLPGRDFTAGLRFAF